MFRTLASRLAVSAIALAAALTSAGQASAQSVADFYKGKTVTIFIGFSPGGSYDGFARMVARHLGKHIPGNPNVVPQNMPGAGSFTAANHIFAVAPKDGTTLGIVSQTAAIEEALKTDGVQYKSAQFNWIGRATSNIEVQVVWHTSKAKSIDDATKNEIPLASTGPGSPSEGYPRMLNGTYGTKFKIIRGYPGSTDGLLAMERGEVDGALTSWNTMKSARKSWLDEKKAAILVQYMPKRTAELQNIPAVTEFAKTDLDREVLAFYASGAEVGRAFMASPGVPADRVAALRAAFDATMKDPEFKADVEKAKFDFEPLGGEAMQKIIADTANVKPAVIERMQALLKE
jgi:tripartite-type tricarboxylate transporter receptor subunit TctC